MTYSIEIILPMIKAKVIRSAKRIFECQDLETKEVIKATALREALISDGHIVVGDIVELQKQENTTDYDLVNVLPRKNTIHRKIVRENKIKVLASNVDLLLIVSSVSKPDYKSALIDRYLIRALEWEVPAIVIFNKMDEFDDHFDIEFEEEKFQSLGVDSFKTSFKEDFSEEVSTSMKELRELLNNKTAILLGQSGVGKSKLISTLSNGKVELTTGRLAKKVKKGAHTTTWSEIIDCGNFDLIDSPGVRSMAVNDIHPDELVNYFPDLHPYIEACKFTNCRHEENSKGCGFSELDPEYVEDLIVLDRLYSFKRIRDEVEAIPTWKRD